MEHHPSIIRQRPSVKPLERGLLKTIVTVLVLFLTILPVLPGLSTLENSSFSGAEFLFAREAIRVAVPATTGGGIRPLSGNVSSRGNLQGLSSGYIPGIMARTEPVRGHVSAQVVKPDIYKAWLEKTHPGFALNISKYGEESIIVVKGQWDSSDKILDKFAFKHRKVSGKDFNKLDLDLSRTKLVIVDCGANLDQMGKQKLRQFVYQGGYLLSTDWDLDAFLSSTFRNYVVWNRGVNHSLIYDANVVSADSVLFKNTVTCAPWKLDQESHLIRVEAPGRVRVLIESQRLRKDDPDGRGILAAAFQFGKGYVLHMAGHFDNNSGIPIKHRLPDPAPVIVISLRQALATNFLVASFKGEPIPVR